MRATVIGIAIAIAMAVAIATESGTLTLLASGLAIGAAVLSPITGLITLVFVAPLPRPLIIPTPGLYVAMLGAILLGVILRLPIDRPRLRRPPAEVTLLGAYLVYVAVHFVGARLVGPVGARGASIASVFSQITTAILTFAIAHLVIRGRSPVPVLTALLASAVLASVLGLAETIGADAIFGGLQREPDGQSSRITGPFGDPNYYGAYLATAVTLAAACAVIARSMWLKVGLVGMAVFLGSALALTLSRGAVAAMLAGLVTLAFTRGMKPGVITLAGLLLATVVAWPTFAELRFGAESDLASAGVGSQFEASGRVDTWLAGLELFLTAPLFGIGWGAFVEEASSGIAAHNWYIAVLAETGVVGFTLWALFIAAVALALWRQPRSARTVGYSVLVVWMVASLSIEVPISYGATAPVVAVLAASVAAKWPERDGSSAPLAMKGSAVRDRRVRSRQSARQVRAGLQH